MPSWMKRVARWPRNFDYAFEEPKKSAPAPWRSSARLQSSGSVRHKRGSVPHNSGSVRHNSWSVLKSSGLALKNSGSALKNARPKNARQNRMNGPLLRGSPPRPIEVK